MSIKHGILAILTQGPAYGLQLRNEIDARVLRETATNVGQIYSTLERLLASGSVRQSSHTDDGLPLYELSDRGNALAHEWLHSPAINRGDPWESMVFQVMLVRSLPQTDSSRLISGMRDHWVKAHIAAQESYAPDLAHDLRSNAMETLSRAALNWLDAVEKTSDHGFAVSSVRPPRGRRPKNVAF
ncbi:PadR family transcriptional regulator [Lysinibacter sp. HNR]|uniref:PadR family transcriptional regulator n=1 Tax=Lysinibacter sp. HNR TaxID=3031408 RepID=UPI002434E7DD|nr:PadR family transcriptional regulator [Lysinibacter sp. HNR]WGD38544.1 PadR family transcriptional regulator [Lysinibacter sp. HNR]